MEIAIICIIAAAIIVAAVSYFALCVAVKPRLYKPDEAETRERKKGNWGDYDSLTKEAVIIKSYDGYELHGELIKNSGKRFVIITHGHTYTRAGSVKYANIFYSLGFNVLIYDLRHHGVNKRCFCSMGEHEGRDIVSVAAYLRERFGDDIEIGLHGESLGAASSLLALGLDDGFSFCIEDCGFSDLKELLKLQIKNKCHLPKFFIYICGLLGNVIYRVNLLGIRPIDSVRNTDTPIFFIHGAADDFIPCSMAEDMYKSCRSKKKIMLFEGAGHAGSFESSPEKYAAAVGEFIKSLSGEMSVS